MSMSKKLRCTAAVIAACLILSDCSRKATGPWPTGPVRLITPFGPGAGSNGVARALAVLLSRQWHQPVTVENIPGADGILAVQAFLHQGGPNSLLLSFAGVYSANPLLHPKLSYEPHKDLPPVSTVVNDTLAFLSPSSLAANSLAELIALAHAKPRSISYTTAPGLPEYVFRSLIRKTGAEMLFVPYKNSIGSLPDLATGRIQVALLPLPAALGQVRAGALKVLAIQNSDRTPALANAPTVAEAGFPELTYNGGLVLFGRENMGLELRERLSREVRESLREPSFIEQITAMGYTAAGSSPEAATERLARSRTFLQQIL